MDGFQTNDSEIRIFVFRFKVHKLCYNGKKQNRTLCDYRKLFLKQTFEKTTYVVVTK